MVTFVTNCYENLGSGWGTHSFFVTHQIIFLKYTISSYYRKVELSGFKIQCCVCVYIRMVISLTSIPEASKE